MRIEYLDEKNFDYPDGCVQITASTMAEAFELGRIAEELRQKEQEFCFGDSAEVFIRIPATKQIVG